MVLQLSVLGIILKPIFESDSPWMVLAYAVFMLLVATGEAVSRPKYSYNVGVTGDLLSIQAWLYSSITHDVLEICRVYFTIHFYLWLLHLALCLHTQFW